MHETKVQAQKNQAEIEKQNADLKAQNEALQAQQAQLAEQQAKIAANKKAIFTPRCHASASSTITTSWTKSPSISVMAR
jgi:uncharacterized protein (DUF3084 family)